MTALRTQYLYIRHNNLYLLALTKRNTNAAEILLFLHKVVEVFTEYFKELEEESIRDNFVIIYELLDEMMDFGYPQTTESKILQEYERRICSFRKPCADSVILLQIHHPGVTQTRDTSASTHRRHQRRQLAERRDQIPQERGLSRRHRVSQSARLRQRKRAAVRDSGRYQDEMLSLWHAGATVRLERQGHVRDNGSGNAWQGRRDGGCEIPPVRSALAL